ncbi:MAG TPA: sigma-70 family RNA polymerase sigma factor [Chloroflexia bacterium]|nr:sigma-70 family RNA polymerase sigma factor [Chloroflexia bacterium]
MDGTLPLLANEKALVARATVEPAAFAAIYDHYFGRIYTYVRYRVRDAALADDLTAAIFTRVLARLGDYDAARAPFAGWLFTIARNAVNDHLRAARRQRWLSLDWLRDHVADGPAPEAALIRNETRAALLVALGRLNERERDLIGLKFGAQLTNRRIAELTGLSESNVGVIVHRAIGRLRADLRIQEGSDDE